MPGWNASRSTQPFRPRSRFHMMSLAEQRDEGRAGALVQAYSILGLQVFQGFPRAVVGHGKTLTGCGKADHGLCSVCQLWCMCRGGSWADGTPVGSCDQTQPQSWHKLAGAGSHKHGKALRGLPRACFPCFPLVGISEDASIRDWILDARLWASVSGTAKLSPLLLAH